MQTSQLEHPEFSIPEQPPAPPGLGPVLLVMPAVRQCPWDAQHQKDIIKDLWAKEMGYLSKRCPNLPKRDSLWTRQHVQCDTWHKNGDLAIELPDRITHQRLLHRLMRAPKGQCVEALKAQLTRAEAEAGDALLQAAANARIRLVRLGDSLLLLPATKKQICGVLVMLAAPEAVSISGHLAAWVA